MRLQAGGLRNGKTLERSAQGAAFRSARPIRKLVRLEGFEPPTNGFGSHYSIRLSYRRPAEHCP